MRDTEEIEANLKKAEALSRCLHLLYEYGDSDIKKCERIVKAVEGNKENMTIAWLHSILRIKAIIRISLDFRPESIDMVTPLLEQAFKQDRWNNLTYHHILNINKLLSMEIKDDEFEDLLQRVFNWDIRDVVWAVMVDDVINDTCFDYDKYRKICSLQKLAGREVPFILLEKLNLVKYTDAEEKLKLYEETLKSLTLEKEELRVKNKNVNSDIKDTQLRIAELKEML